MIDFSKELNEEQYKAVTQGDGPCLVLAGAGSGKTRAITYRVAYLLEHGVDPEEIVLMTFTNKAASEMLSRVEQIVGVSPRRINGGTFHSIANRLLRVYAGNIGFGSNFGVLDQEDSKDLIKLCIKELGINTKDKRFPSPAVVQSIISNARNHEINIENLIRDKYLNFTEIVDDIVAIAKRYDEKKRGSNSMDFDDLLIRFLYLLDNFPEVHDKLSKQFKYVLVDEYQDTNKVQAKIVYKISSFHRNILVVGDDAQSIYSFRGADIKNILDFPKLFTDAKVFYLLSNYRSTPEILAVADSVIKHNKGYFLKKLRAHRASFEKPNIVVSDDIKDEAKYIVDKIEELQDENDSNETAVLFRAFFHSQILELELRKRGMSYDFRGGLTFFERAHIKDTVSYIRALNNFNDEMAWRRILSHQPGIGEVTASSIIEKVKQAGSLNDVMGEGFIKTLPPRATAGWRDLCMTISNMKKHHPSPAGMIRAICAGSYKQYAIAEFPDALERLEDIERLAYFADSYTDCSTFLDSVLLQDETSVTTPKRNSARPKIVLSTIHQAKGLEWDNVFLIHLADGSFPNQRALFGGNNSEIEEERRLFYVAATRAKNKLFLTYPRRGGWGEEYMNNPSMFLREIDADLVDTKEDIDAPVYIRNYDDIDYDSPSSMTVFNKK